MDYEKKYKDALDAMRMFIYPKLCGDAKLAAENVFSELRESEDERIRKEIIGFLDYAGDNAFIRTEDYENEPEWRRWLEKQKINTEGDFARGYDCGYECCLNSHGAEWFEKQKEIPMPNSTELIEMWHKEKTMLKEKDFRGDEWRLAYNAFLDGFTKGTLVKFDEQKEQKPDNLDESEKVAAAYQLGRSDERKKQKNFRKLYEDIAKSEWFKKAYEGKSLGELASSASWKDNEQKPVENQDYSGLTDFERAIHRGFLCAGVENVPVTIIKETAQDCLAQIPDKQWDELQAEFRNINEAFEDGKKEVVAHPEKYGLCKPVEWSEEDEKNLELVMDCIYEFYPVPVTKYKLKDWLKSLRPQKKEDLPKWLIDNDYVEDIDGKNFSLHSVGLAYRGYYIPYSDLLKLPREDEK